MAKRIKYDWKKTLKKGLRSGAVVFLTGLLVLWQKDPKYMALIPVVEMALNYFKHRK